jgi:hypothetical protein
MQDAAAAFNSHDEAQMRRMWNEGGMLEGPGDVRVIEAEAEVLVCWQPRDLRAGRRQ